MLQEEPLKDGTEMLTSPSFVSDASNSVYLNCDAEQHEQLQKSTEFDPHELRDLAKAEAEAAELKEMFGKLRACMEIREKYMGISLQRDSDNPKNQEGAGHVEPPLSADQSHTGMFANHGKGFTLANYDLERCTFIPPADDVMFNLDEDGVYRIYASQEECTKMKPLYSVPSIKDYYMDCDTILNVLADGPLKSWTYRRLMYLESLFEQHVLMNESAELSDQKKVPHRDFYNVRKVDTHIHHSSCMNAKHLLRFIKSKLKNSPNDVVIYRDGKYLTLQQVFESLNLTAYDLSIDTLDMHAHKDSFHRFDMFNLKYNPIGESRLREIFLKSDNLVKGRYLAEITKEVISDFEVNKYQMAEYRISIYGRTIDEWDKLASWVCDNQIFSDNIRWIIQVPRLYDIYKKSGNVENFEAIVRNVFLPLFEVTKDPTSHPKLHIFLKRVIGFDTVDDESKVERRIHRKYPFPKYWSSGLNPPYSYYIYYIFANMCSLNQFRKARGLNTFVLRPHSGEAGDTDHLTCAFITSQSICHGILLRKVPALQYLFYLMQIGLAISPLSNNALFLTYERNPFPSYFKRGLNVSLSTDDPLQFHFTKEPLIEEYSVAAQIWKMSSCDMCEIARNSVLQSGFESEVKRKWLGQRCLDEGPDSNEIKKTNVANVRVKFRWQVLNGERAMVYGAEKK